MLKRKTIHDRLSDKLVACETGCWEFIGSCNSFGHGRIWYNGRLESTHRVAYELCIKPIPDGMFVCHTCDNPPCCNPEHLFLGTAQDNVNDKMTKNRHKASIGINNGRTLLTEATVLEIKASLNCGESLAVIMAKHNVRRENLHKIRSGQTWKNL